MWAQGRYVFHICLVKAILGTGTHEYMYKCLWTSLFPIYGRMRFKLLQHIDKDQVNEEGRMEHGDKASMHCFR